MLATKFFMSMGEDPNRRAGSRRWIVKAVEDSLRRLGLLIGIIGGPLGVLLGGTYGMLVGSLFDIDDVETTESVLREISNVSYGWWILGCRRPGGGRSVR